MKIFITLFFIILNFNYTYSQVSDKQSINLLLIKLSNTTIDTIKVNTLNDLVFSYRFIDSKIAIKNAFKALNLAQKINYDLGISESYNGIGYCYAIQSNFDKSIPYLNKALQTAPNKNSKSKALNALGVTYTMKSSFAIALDYYHQSLKILEELKDQKRIAVLLFNLGNVYSQLKNYEKANEYYYKSIKIDNEPDSIKSAYCNMGLNYLDLNNYDNALQSFEKVLKTLNNSAEDKALKAYCLNGLGEAYFYKNDLKNSQSNYEKAIILNKEIEDKYILAESIRGIGNIYVKQAAHEKNTLVKNNLLERSISSFEESIKISTQVSDLNNLIDTYERLSNAQNLLGNFDKALQTYKKSVQYKDSIFNSENKETVKNLEDKRVIDLKNKEIQITKLDIEKKSTLNKILIGSSIGLLLLGFLGYRNFRNKRKLQNLKISELEKDKQLFAIDSMLKGQEEERSRIAKDLHDGLGGLLSGTKLSFTNMKENLLLTPENALQFEKSLSMLDITIADLRKVAHNLMPEALVKFGLNDALKDFCSTIQLASNITVDYQKIGLERKIGNTAETFIYRIIQELVNNAVKHAQATEILVQIAYANDKIAVTVEDNGKGYDQNQTTTGDGLDNIAYRVKYLNGTIDTQTSINNGTSVNIELNV